VRILGPLQKRRDAKLNTVADEYVRRSGTGGDRAWIGWGGERFASQGCFAVLKLKVARPLITRLVDQSGTEIRCQPDVDRIVVHKVIAETRHANRVGRLCLDTRW